jgi:hypothetical protein
MPDMSTVLPLLAGRDIFWMSGGKGGFARMFFASVVLVDVKGKNTQWEGFNFDIYQRKDHGN